MPRQKMLTKGSREEVEGELLWRGKQVGEKKNPLMSSRVYLSHARILLEEIDRLTACAESQRLEVIECRETIQRQANLVEQLRGELQVAGDKLASKQYERILDEDLMARYEEHIKTTEAELEVANAKLAELDELAHKFVKACEIAEKAEAELRDLRNKPRFEALPEIPKAMTPPATASSGCATGEKK